MPLVKVKLIKEKQGYYWVVKECPFCGKEHIHGAGTLNDNPIDYLTGRSSHCDRFDYPDYGDYQFEWDREDMKKWFKFNADDD